MKDDDSLGDWRIENVTTLAEDLPSNYPGGPDHKAGARVTTVTVTRRSSGDLISFETPGATALALNIAIVAARKAEELRSRVKYVSAVSPYGPGQTVPGESSTALYDFLEQCMIAVTFSFQALETFCNYSITRNLTGKMVIRLKRGEENLTASEIERFLSTGEKLAKILPKLLDIPTPSGKAIWERFVKLQQARDATMHLKGFDQNPQSSIDRESLFFQLLNRDPFEFPETAVALISHFHDGKDRPRWLSMAPSARSS